METEEKEPVETEPVATDQSETEPVEPVADPYSSSDQEADADLIQKQNEQILENQKAEAETEAEQNEVLEKQSSDIQTIQAVMEEQATEPDVTTQVALTDSQWSELYDWTNELDLTGVATFNVLLGVVMGYVAVRGFFDAWKVS